MQRIELRIKENLYQEITNKKPKLIKRNAVSKINIYLEDIRMIGTVLSNKGTELKDFAKVYIRDIGFLTVNHSYDELNQIQHEYNNGRSNRTAGFGATQEHRDTSRSIKPSRTGKAIKRAAMGFK